MTKDIKMIAHGPEITITKAMIEEICAEWERAHPDQEAGKMPSAEFAERMMEKIKAAIVGRKK